MKSAMQNIHFLYLIQKDLVKQEITCREFGTFIQRLNIFLICFEKLHWTTLLSKKIKKVVYKILQATEKMTRADNQQTLVKVNFLLKAFTSLKTSSYDNLNTTSPVFFHFVEGFGKLHGAKHFIYIWMLEDPIQKLETSTCGPFQLHFLTVSLIPKKIVAYKNIINLQKRQ